MGSTQQISSLARRTDLRRVSFVAGIFLASFFSVGILRWLYVFEMARREGVLSGFFGEQWRYFLACDLFAFASVAAVIALRRWPRLVSVLVVSIAALAVAVYLEESVRNRGAQIERFGESGHSYFYATWWISPFWLLIVPGIVVISTIAEWIKWRRPGVIKGEGVGSH